MIIVRYSEIGLKGENRTWFEERLARNMRDRLHGLPVERVERRRGRLYVHLGPGADDEAGARPVVERLSDTPGIRTLSHARPVASALPEIERAAVEVVRDAIARRAAPPATFRVTSVRADKTFPLTSVQLDAQVGGAILAAFPALRVKLEGHDLEVGIEVQADRAYLMTEWIDGPGGLPVGTSGPVVLLLSGGIDSPVAGFLLQKRGCAVAPLFCHAFPYTGDAAREKVRDLARELARRQTVLDLRTAPIGEAQAQLRDRCRPEMLVVLYRRLMLRLAERVAAQLGAHALATGDNVGQVASQTLPNLRAVEAATLMPVLRPLATYDKEETVKLARRLKTYEISIRPADDCCQLFVPRHPATHVAVAAVEAEEAKIDMTALVEAAASRIETERFYRGVPSSSSLPISPPGAAG